MSPSLAPAHGGMASTVLILVCFGLVVQVVRRRLLHPLRSFPGPWLNSVTELPASAMLATGHLHSYYRKLHERYGPVVRVAPNELSFSGVAAWEDIHGIRKGAPQMEKSPIFIGAVSGVDGQTGISLASPQAHTRQRRALAYPFSNTALLQQQYIMQRHVDKLVAAVRRMTAAGEAVNVANWFTFITFDLMGDLCFAEPFGCLDQAANTAWSTSVVKVFVAATYLQAIRRLAGVGNWMTDLLTRLLLPADSAKWRATHFTNSREKTLRRLAEPDRDHKDIIHHIVSNSESRQALSETEIILNMVLLISAGTETTANLLTGWTNFMCSHRHVYDRLVAEIRTAFPTAADISWQTTKELPYLNATINEALRLFSPAPANIQRVVPAGGAKIDGHWVPAGTTVGVAAWAAAHSVDHYALPNEFRPERWLGDEDSRFAHDKLHASQPFSLGPRGCLGKNLAYFEMRLIIAHLLWNFDFHLAAEYEALNKVWETSRDMHRLRVFQTWVKPDLWVRMTEVTH